MAGYSGREYTIVLHGEPMRMRGAAVSPAVFPLARRRRPRSGASSTPGEDANDAATVVVLSHRLWTGAVRRPLRRVVGRSILVDGQPHTIVGVGAA